MIWIRLTSIACSLMLWQWSCSGCAAEVDMQGLEFFEKHVRPVLVSRCYECHSEDSVESGLRVDSLSGLLTGGSRGPAIVVGDPKKSLLIGAINHSDQLQMPPKQKLARDEIAAIAEWIKIGAPWPNSPAATEPITAANLPRQSARAYTEADKNFWSFKPVVKADLPEVRNKSWVQSPIDRFILAKLEAANLQPAPVADKRTLIRRMTFDLIGLPPTSEEVAAFLVDDSPAAVAKLIERLLASPHYGERWGRHWLDVARYADSNGLDENLAFANAFRYRDYVVAAFNADKPYDQFLQEQIAGDLLYADLPDDSESVAKRQAGLTATSFLVMGAKMLAEDDPVKMQMDIIDEQVDTIGRAFMGLTLGCARCHDHKFDPISIEDYYALAGIFKSTKTMAKFSVVAHWQELPLATADEVAQQKQRQQQIAQQEAEIDRLVQSANAELLRAERAHVGSYLLAAAEQLQSDRWLQHIAQHRPGDEKLDNGALLLEAEDFTRGNVNKDHVHYGAGIGVLVNGGPLPNFVEYDFELKTAGNYLLHLRYAAADARPVKLLINDEMVNATVADKVTGSWFPNEQKWQREGIFRLQAGKNTLRLERDQPFPHIDRVLLIPAAHSVVAATQNSHLPKHPLVEQWVAYLQRIESNEESPLALWNRALKAGEVPAEWPRESFPSSYLLAAPRPITLIELATRYETLFQKSIAVEKDLEQANLQSLRDILQAADGPFALPKAPESLYPTATRDQIAQKRASLSALKAKPLANPQVMAVSEDKPENLRVHLRGSHTTLGGEVSRRFPQILTNDETPAINLQQSGRLELAQWLTNGKHPLTARVMVNRVWQQHFGVGLVRSPDNFGKLGEIPTHPELLDWLALRFVEDGWSIKSLHRAIMQSATYQMSTELLPAGAEIDPENLLYWRRNRHRLDIEALRDAMLAISGNLDRTMTGSLLPTENFKYVTNTGNSDPVKYNSTRRSIYLPVVRSALYNVFQAFDFAEPSVSSGKRDVTTVAPQALFMMNSELVSQCTNAWAERLLGTAQTDDDGRIAQAFLEAYARLPSESEITQSLAYLAQYEQSLSDLSIPPSARRLRAWQSFCRVVLAANEFIYVE